MAILAECPICHKKHAVKNRLCSCGEDLVKAKRSNKVKYHIVYRVKGKQRWELVGNSIEEARACHGKRISQKAENNILDIKLDTKMTFQELTEWYLNLEKVKALSSHWRVKMALDRFNEEFSYRIVSTILPSEIENYQAKRKAQGRSDATVDQEVGAAKTVINKAFENDMVGGDTLKKFKLIKKLLKPRSNKRDMVLTVDQADLLMENCPRHVSDIVATAYFTGMRKSEILNLTWDRIDMKQRLISLRAKDTKNGRPRIVPISDELYPVLKSIPRNLHDDHVLLYKGKSITDIRTGLKIGCKKTGILYGRFVQDGFTFHDLRHTFNTDTRKAGVQQSVIMAIMGHEDPGMFHRYNTIDMEDLRQAVSQLDNFRASVRQNVRQKKVSEK